MQAEEGMGESRGMHARAMNIIPMTIIKTI